MIRLQKHAGLTMTGHTAPTSAPVAALAAFITTTLLLFMLAGLAHAEDAAQPSHQGPRAMWCQNNPEQCQEVKERREAWCKENAQRCAEMKTKFEQRREACEKDPEACKQQRAEWHEKMQQRSAAMEVKCKAEPEACKAWRHHGPQHGVPLAPAPAS